MNKKDGKVLTKDCNKAHSEVFTRIVDRPRKTILSGNAPSVWLRVTSSMGTCVGEKRIFSNKASYHGAEIKIVEPNGSEVDTS